MFGLFKEAAKRTKYEMHARDYLAEKHRFDIEFFGAIRLAELTDEIISEMKKSGLDGERQYTELLVTKLKKLGYI